MYKIRNYKVESKKIHKTHKIISTILYIVIIPILIINFTLIIKSFITPDKIADFLGYKNFIIVSKSMEPTIMVGDAIFSKEISENELKINDIISFHDGDDINTHRIVGISEENGVKLYQTKGDNNKKEDKEKIPYSKIEGKYQFKISHFGVIVEALQSKIVLFILVIIVILDMYFNHRLKIKMIERRKKKQDYEKSH